jgi:hypothetical protein
MVDLYEACRGAGNNYCEDEYKLRFAVLEGGTAACGSWRTSNLGQSIGRHNLLMLSVIMLWVVTLTVGTRDMMV